MSYGDDAAGAPGEQHDQIMFIRRQFGAFFNLLDELVQHCDGQAVHLVLGRLSTRILCRRVVRTCAVSAPMPKVFSI